jgi:hypothetical protein
MEFNADAIKLIDPSKSLDRKRNKKRRWPESK